MVLRVLAIGDLSNNITMFKKFTKSDIHLINFPWDGPSKVIDIKDDVAQLGIFPSDNLDSEGGEGKLNSGARCPDCSAYMIFQEGCHSCRDCGYTKCE